MGTDVLKLSAVALIAICAVMIIKSYRPELAMQVSIGAGIAILAYGMNTVGGIAQTADSLFSRYGIDPEGMKSIAKMIGIAYIAQFSADTCRDCGESSLAGKVEFAGRLMMVSAALPLVISTLEAIGGLMGQ
ncbi:MAG: hypothetical protein IJN83_07665 [Clostridia bacterium]|nr:hypothetical protein [Clostridia bacterium]